MLIEADRESVRLICELYGVPPTRILDAPPMRRMRHKDLACADFCVYFLFIHKGREVGYLRKALNYKIANSIHLAVKRHVARVRPRPMFEVF